MFLTFNDREWKYIEGRFGCFDIDLKRGREREELKVWIIGESI